MESGVAVLESGVAELESGAAELEQGVVELRQNCSSLCSVQALEVAGKRMAGVGWQSAEAERAGLAVRVRLAGLAAEARQALLQEPENLEPLAS